MTDTKIGKVTYI